MTVKPEKAVKAPEGAEGMVEELTFELNCQNLTKNGSQSELAILTVKVNSGAWSKTYHMLLDAPEGDYKNYREYYVKDNRVVKANSWYDRALRCVFEKSSCRWSLCEINLQACRWNSWSTYLYCIIGFDLLNGWCSDCLLTCYACATCSCHWSCAWAFGCCALRAFLDAVFRFDFLFFPAASKIKSYTSSLFTESSSV